MDILKIALSKFLYFLPDSARCPNLEGHGLLDRPHHHHQSHEFVVFRALELRLGLMRRESVVAQNDSTFEHATFR